MTSLAPLMSSVKQDWCTPPEILELVRRVSADGTIGLDPATNVDNPTEAKHFYTQDDDGLAQNWAGKGLVYLNPPYGPALPIWAKKIKTEVIMGAEIIALVPARTDTRWFQDHLAYNASALCFWKGRIKFVGAPASAPFPSMFLYFGKNWDAFNGIFGSRGWCAEGAHLAYP